MPTFPALPDIESYEPWRLQSVQDTSLDIYVDVPGAPQSTRPEEARWAQGACGGPLTLLTLSGGGRLEPLQFRIQMRLHYGPNRNARRAALEAAWLARGPYRLTAPASVIPGGSLLVLCDPSQGGLEYQPDGGTILLTMGFREALAASGGSPVASTALVTWELLAATTGGATVTARVTWEYAGDDQTAQDALYLYQTGTLTEDIRGAPFAPDGAWLPLVGTNGQPTGSAVVTVPTTRLDAFPSWLLGYYHYDRGLLPVPATVTVTPTGAGVQIFWGWLAASATAGEYTAAVTWQYLGSDPTSTDQLYLFQAGTTGADIAAHATDPVSGRWFPLLDTHGQGASSATLQVDAALFDAHSNWHVGYYHATHGLLDSGVIVPANPLAPVPPVTLGFAWQGAAYAAGSANYANYQLTWTYGWADQHPDDWILIHDDTLTLLDAQTAPNDYPDFHWYGALQVGRAGRSGSIVLSTAEVTYDAQTPRHLTYFSVLHGLLGTIDLPAFPL